MRSTEDVKIPKERVGVLIGKGGETKKAIESKLEVSLRIDSEEGDVEISADEMKDPMALWKARDVVKAIGRGFSPQKAFLLFDDGYIFDIVDFTDYMTSSEKAFSRTRSRLIGSEGKVRSKVEFLTDTFISVFGKTVCIIGPADKLPVAREAVEMLVTGADHNTLWKFLEKNTGKSV